MVRVLVRGSILVLFGFAAVAVMTMLFGAQMRFDQTAEREIKGLDGPRAVAALTTTAIAGTADPGNEDALPPAAYPTEQSTDPQRLGDADISEATATVRPTALTPAQIAGLIAVTPPSDAPVSTRPSAMPAAGKNAVTIRIGKTEGAIDAALADRWVDVVMTRQLAEGHAVSDVVVQNAHVLALDRGADGAGGEPASANAVTLEVDPEDAPKLILANRVGTLSLIERASGDRSVHDVRPIGVADLIKAAPPLASAPPPAAKQDDARFVSIRVNRGGEPTVHRVPRER
jgi:Flp pilus assembly protein CpaB